MSEVWRPCPAWPELYEVSDLGRVRSWNNNRWGRRSVPRVLAQRINADGYRCVCLGRRTVKIVSRLVCEAFHGPAPPGMEAAHFDGDTGNNRAANLRWATPIQNAEDKRRHGTIALGERNGSAKLTAEQARRIRTLRQEGMRNKDVAALMGVAPQTVSGITRGRKWRHLWDEPAQA